MLRKLSAVRLALAAAMIGVIIGPSNSRGQDTTSPPVIGSPAADEQAELVRRGRDLIVGTFTYIGPLAAPDKRYAGNNLACSNCHLRAGTKTFGLPLFGLLDEYPRYSQRIGAAMTIEDRVNTCMTRSMNGRALPLQSPEMKALVAYIDSLSVEADADRRMAAPGKIPLAELERAADPERGRLLYGRNCLACHAADGQGLANTNPMTDLGYAVPPLWGPDSFNDGAGMNRLMTIARFVHFNMPHGASYLDPELSMEDAWDISAYVVSKPRPRMPDLERDYPDLSTKPIDAPYGPYADRFSEQQHKYGPFAPIRAELLQSRQKGSPVGR